MPNRNLLQSSDITAVRCPRCHKRLEPEIGQHEDRGDLVYRLWCLNDGYSEPSVPTVAAAARTSPVVRSAAERLRAVRLGGVEIPLVYDDAPVEVQW